MKFNLITLIAITMMVGTASAQTFNIGIKGGLNLPTINVSNNQSHDIKPSFHFGLLGHIHMADHFALQPEVVFSAQGTKYGNGQKLDLNYVNFPLLFQYMFDNGFRLQAGPQLGFLVSARANGENVKDNYKGVEVGLGIGASYVHPPSGFGVDARYNHGLSNINNNEAIDSYNRGFQLGVFYVFRHKS